MIFAYWFAILYIWYELSRILEEYFYNNICIFCGIIIKVYGSWYSAFARLAAIWENSETTNETSGETTGKPAGRAIDEIASRATGKAAGNEATSKVRTIKIWIDITIILTNSLAYMLKLEKRNKTT